MSQIALIGAGNASVSGAGGPATTWFGSWSGLLITGQGTGISATTEANAQTKNRGASTLQSAYIWFPRTSTPTNSSTFTSRQNTAAGNISINIPFGPVADILLSDLTHTDSLADGDLYNYQIAFGANPASPLRLASVSAQIVAASGQCFTQLGAFTPNGLAQTLSVARWMAFGGGLLTSQSSEAPTQTPALESATLSNMQAAASAGASTATMISRVATANGNQTLTVGTGFIEDTTHTDSITVGQKFNAQSTQGASTKTYTLIAIKYLSANADRSVMYMAGTTVSGSSAINTYPGFGHSISASLANEHIFACALPAVGTASLMSVNVTANTVASAQPWTIRHGAANPGNMVCTTTASTPGVYQDTTHTDVYSAGDRVSYIVQAAWTASLTVASAGFAYSTVTPASPFAQDDWPVPKGYPIPLENRTQADPLKLNLVGQDNLMPQAWL